MTLILTGCSKQTDRTNDTKNFVFQLSDDRYTITVTESDVIVSDRSGILSFPVRYNFDDRTLNYESLSFSYEPLKSSVLQIGQLIKKAFTDNEPEGNFLDLPYRITYEGNGTPKEITWGEFHFDFIQ